MSIEPISLLGGEVEHLEMLERLRGKKLCCRKIWKLKIEHVETKQVYKYIYPKVLYLAEVCPYLGFLYNGTYCAGNYKDNEECLRVWKGKIPYRLVLVYIEELKPKRERRW